jgi:hypothetical protein
MTGQARLMSLLVILTAGCAPSERDLTGVYVAQNSNFVDSLTLMPMGRFDQHVIVRNGPRRDVTNGTWRLIVRSPLDRYVLIRHGIVAEEGIDPTAKSKVVLLVGGRALALEAWEIDHGLGSYEGLRYRRVRRLRAGNQ